MKLLLASACVITLFSLHAQHLQKDSLRAPNLGIAAEQRQEVGNLLNNLLANEVMLYIKTLNFHWNVEGIHFHNLHEFFKDLYEKSFIIIDDVAERARTVGSFAFGSCQEYLNHTTLHEQAGVSLGAKAMINQLLQDHEAIIQQLRHDIDLVTSYNDAGTANFLTDLMEKHEKIAWMLRSHLGR